MFGHAIQEPPFGLSAGREVPGDSGSDEHVVDAVPIEVCDGKIAERVGSRVKGVLEDDVLREILGQRLDRGALGLEEDIVVDRRGAPRGGAPRVRPGGTTYKLGA